jgi:hypothetical protein
LGEQLLKRHGPSNGLCALCGAWEDYNHIFFTFPTAGVRDLLSCDWNPAGAGNFIALAQGLNNPLRRLAWFMFAAQFWTLWNIRYKLAIEGNMIGNPTDVFYQMFIHISVRGFWSDGGTRTCWTWWWATSGGCTHGRGLSTHEYATSTLID